MEKKPNSPTKYSSQNSSPKKTSFSHTSPLNGKLNINNNPEQFSQTTKSPKKIMFSSPDKMSQGSPSKSSASKARSQRSRISIFDTYDEKADPSKKDQRLKNKINGIMCEGPNSEREALLSTLLYLDIGPNLSISNLSQISQKMVVLKLTDTKLNSPKIPFLPSLRTLYLDQTKLKTLNGFPLLPNLRFLSLANNNLENFGGLPVLPTLEELDLTGNKVKIEIKNKNGKKEERYEAVNFPVELALQASASVSLIQYNGEQVTEEQIRKAYSRSPLIGYALRQGMPLFNNEQSNKEIEIIANDYLTKDLFEEIKEEANVYPSLETSKQNPSNLVLPIKAKYIKWFLNRPPTPKNPSEWDPIIERADDTGSKKQAQSRQMLGLTQLMYQHLVRCEFSLPGDTQNRRYSMYTLNVIGTQDTNKKQKQDLILPFPLNPKVTGDPYEGSLASVVALPVPCNISWYLQKKCIGKGVNSIRLSEECIGQEVSVLLQPYYKPMPEITFTLLLTKTNPVQQLNPIVTNVEFPNDIIEGTPIKFKPIVLPKREGNSEISIERTISPSGNWDTTAELDPNRTVYKPTLEDVGCYLRCRYIPVLDTANPTDSQSKPVFYFYSKTRVIPGYPAFSNPIIAGDPKYGHSLVAIADYFGGHKGQCAYKWYKSQEPFYHDEETEALLPFNMQETAELIPDETSAILRLKKSTVSYYIGVEMTPIRNDGTVGDPIYTALTTPVENGPKTSDESFIRKLPKNDKIVAYSKIKVSQDVSWYRTNTNWLGDLPGFEKIFEGTEYTPNELDVGQYLRLISDDGNIDVIIGDVKPSIPFIHPFELNIQDDKTIVGKTASIPEEVISYGFNDNDSDSQLSNQNRIQRKKVEIIWVRILKDNNVEEVIDIDTTQYTFQTDDVGCRIKAVVYPLDDDGNRYEPSHSTPTDPIEAFKYKQPVIEGTLKVGEEISIDFDQPIYSVTWKRIKSKDCETILTYIFDHYDIVEDEEEEQQLIPFYKIENESDNEFYQLPSYTIGPNDVDFQIQADVTAGEIIETTNETDPTQKFVEIVPSRFINTILKATFSNKNVKASTKQAQFQSQQTVIPDSLHVDVDELTKSLSNKPLLEGQTLTIPTTGIDPKGHKPKILWQILTTDNKWVTQYTGQSYTFKPSDIDCTFRIICENTGEEFNLGVIDPISPSVTSFTIRQDTDGTIVISDAKYKGGYEGKSKFFYSLNANRNTDEDLSYIDTATLDVRRIRKITKVSNDDDEINVFKFTPTRDMFNRCIDIGYLPIRRDGEEGDLVWSKNSIIVKSIPIVDAFIKYPNDDMDHLTIGNQLKVVIKRCSIKTCSYKFTWKRYIPQDEDENSFDKETVDCKGNTYTLTEKDNGAFIVCQIVAIAENGYVSPIFVLDTYQIELQGINEYTVSIHVKERQQAEGVKSTRKRSNGHFLRSSQIYSEVDTGDQLTPEIKPLLKKGLKASYFWQICYPSDTITKKSRKVQQNPEEQESADGNDISSNWKTISNDNNYNCSFLDLTGDIRCVVQIYDQDQNCVDEIQSDQIGPIKMDPNIEARAKAVIRANSLRIQGKAPNGSGKWEFGINSKGLTIINLSKSGMNNESIYKWSDVTYKATRQDLELMELSTGPASRILFIPELIDKRMQELIPSDEVRDFILYIIEQYKKSQHSSNSK